MLSVLLAYRTWLLLTVQIARNTNAFSFLKGHVYLCPSKLPLIVSVQVTILHHLLLNTFSFNY